MRIGMGLIGFAAAVLAFGGCAPKSDDARVRKLEDRVTILETKLESLADTRSAGSTQRQETSPPIRSIKAGAAEAFTESQLGIDVLSVTGRVTEANNTWWKWATVTTLANTNVVPLTFNLRIQFLDKDGFPVDQRDDYDVILPPMKTNKFTSYSLVTFPAAKTIRSFKALAITQP